MKRAIGWLVTLLGAVGIVTCIAGLVVVWIAHARIQRPLAEVVDTLTGLGAEVEVRADEVAGGVQSARDAVTELDQRVPRQAQDILNLSEEDLARIGEGYDGVRRVVQRLRELAELAGAALSFVEQTLGMVESTVGFVRTDREARASLWNALEEGRNELEEASRLLDEVLLKLDGIRSGGGVGMDSGPIRSLAEGIGSSLEALQGHVETFAAGVGELRDGIEALHRRIRGVLFRAALILSLLLVWQLAAQASLAVHGWGWAKRSG